MRKGWSEKKKQIRIKGKEEISACLKFSVKLIEKFANDSLKEIDRILKNIDQPQAKRSSYTPEEIKTYVKDVQTKLKEYTRNHLSTFETDIMDMLNSSHTWVFPGGKTFIFKDIYFSDKTDLVTHVTYVDPDTE